MSLKSVLFQYLSRLRRAVRDAVPNRGRAPQPAAASRPASLSPAPPPERPSRSAELSIRPETFGPRDAAFLLGAAEQRMGRSLAASLAGHIVAGLLLALVISLTPEPVYELIVPARESYSIVWLPDEGPGGGGGGGGN